MKDLDALRRKLGSRIFYREEEKDVEKYFVKRCRSLGWDARKYQDLSENGGSDRLVFSGFGSMFFVELKKKIGKLSALQESYHLFLNEMGCRSYQCYTKEQVDAVIDRETYLLFHHYAKI